MPDHQKVGGLASSLYIVFCNIVKIKPNSIEEVLKNY